MCCGFRHCRFVVFGHIPSHGHVQLTRHERLQILKFLPVYRSVSLQCCWHRRVEIPNPGEAFETCKTRGVSRGFVDTKEPALFLHTQVLHCAVRHW